MRKKILLISNVDWFFLSHRLPIGLEALAEGYEVHLATKFTQNKQLLLNYGFVLHPLGIHRTEKNIFNLIKNFINILLIIFKVKPNLIHAITIKPVLIGGIAARICNNIPFVASISGLGYVFVSEGKVVRIIKKIIKLFYAFSFSNKYLKVIFQNRDDLEIVQKFCNLTKQDSELINGSGINLSIYKPVIKKKLSNKVLFASRLLKTKGINEFVDSLRYLKGENFKYVIAGKLDKDNPDCISKCLIKDWDSIKEIKFVGDKKDIYKLIQQSRIVVLPSYYGEGLPKILIEAAACGVPVITTDHPGCRDAIIPNITGLLVPIKDSKALSEAIRKLLNDDQLCIRMGYAGRDLALKRYDINYVVKTHMRIYRELINKKDKLC